MNRKKILITFLQFAVFILIFAVYLATVPSAYKNNDSPETTIAVKVLGIGHPPGYPLYAICAKAATYIPLANPAFRVNLFVVILSMFVLLMTYMISIKLLNVTSDAEGNGAKTQNEVIALLPIVLLAFSYIYWNQSVEAKGGIYILNLLLLSINIYFSIMMLEKFSIKYLYIISFVSGLSLTNHWPSAIIILPVFLPFYIASIKRLKPVRWLNITAFFILALSVYLYLPIRALNESVLNWGNPATIKDMLWVILRKAYIYPVKPSLDLYVSQILEFLRFFITNYSAFILFAFAGGYILYNKSRKNFYMLISIFIIVVLMVVFYNRTKKEVIYLMDIFLLPAEYVSLLLIVPGLQILKSFYKNKGRFYALVIVMFGLLLTMIYFNFNSNNSSRDFILYDYGNNILNTIQKDSLYVASGDYNAMPIYYAQTIDKRRKDIKFVTESFLIFKWGIDDFVKTTKANVILTPFKRDDNIRSIIENQPVNTATYRNFFWDNPVVLNKDKYIEQQEGILVAIRKQKQRQNAVLFSLYNYRGAIEKTLLSNIANTSLATWYPVCMVNAANALMEEGRYEESIRLNKMALAFPVNKPDGNILFNISFAYNKLGDMLNEMQYLKMACDKQSDILAVYERYGLLCYNLGLLDNALYAFNEAIKRGSTLDYIKKGKETVEQYSSKDRLEIGLIKANEHLVANELAGAVEISKFLLEKHYKSDIIHKNIGVYHFKTLDYKNALTNFLASKNETQDAGTSLYIAITYEKLGMFEKAIDELTQANVLFPNENAIKDKLESLKELYKNVKSDDSLNRPR